jgi:hypothetical protein
MAARTALSSLINAFNWSYYYQRGRFATDAPYSTGTITYDATGGDYERQLTLAGGIWPAWSTYGNVILDNIVYEVAERVDDTVLTLSATNAPTEDIAAGSTYTLFRDTYVLPVGFRQADRMLNASNGGYLIYEHPRVWLESQRITPMTAQPVTWTITGDPNYAGMLAVRFFPAPDALYQMDYLYQRSARDLAIEEYKVGTVTATSGSATLVGTGTSWSAKHIGSVVRLSADSVNHPTGMIGAYPHAMERVIMSVINGTNLVMDAVATETLTSVKHVISDPIDIDVYTMLTALMRGIEYQCAIHRRMDKAIPDASAAWVSALLLAQQSDNRTFQSRSSGLQHTYYIDLPAGPDIE